MMEKATIYKIKEDTVDFGSFIRALDSKKRVLPQLATLNIDALDGVQVEARAAFRDGFGATKTEDDIPWLRFLNSGRAPQDKFTFTATNKFPSAIVAIKLSGGAGQKFFVLTFGLGGESFLNNDFIVRDFGVRVAMNICDPAKLKRVQTSIHEAVSTQSEKQISVGSDFSVFRVDDEKEFLRSLAGSAKVEYSYIDSLTGRDSVSIKINKDDQFNWNNIFSRILDLDAAYNDNSYKTTFKGYDKFHFETDPILIQQLDDLVFKEFMKENPSNIHLSPPEFIDYENYSFVYQGDDSETGFGDISLTDIKQFRQFRANSGIKSLRSMKIYLKSADTGATSKFWPVYRCLVAEITYDKHVYVLSMGQWKRISDDFVSEVDKYSATVPVLTLPYAPDGINIWDPNAKKDKDGNPKGENREDVFNDCVNNNSGEIALLDKSKINIGGERRYEICDLLHSDKSIIHVKKFKSGTASISHLFLQGRFYSEAFLSDEKCRVSIREFISKNIPPIDQTKFLSIVPENRSDIISNEYNVIFCIISDEDITVDKLPFMARYELMYTHKHLCGALGLKCSIAFPKVVYGP